MGHDHASRLCSRSRSRSKVTWYGNFCAGPKIAFSHRQMARLRPNMHTMVSRWAYIHGVLKVKVKVKGHVTRAFCAGPEIAFSRRHMAWLRPSLNTMVSMWACIHGVLKLKVKKPGGYLFLALPMNENRKKCVLQWNAHRQFSYFWMQHLTANLKVLEEINRPDGQNTGLYVLQKLEW